MDHAKAEKEKCWRWGAVKRCHRLNAESNVNIVIVQFGTGSSSSGATLRDRRRKEVFLKVNRLRRVGRFSAPASSDGKS